MMTFLSIMIICIISEVIGSITMFALNKDSGQQMLLRERMLDSLKQYEKHNDTWDMVQTDLECCGVHSHQDHSVSPLPASCCGPLKLNINNQAEECK